MLTFDKWASHWSHDGSLFRRVCTATPSICSGMLIRHESPRWWTYRRIAPRTWATWKQLGSSQLLLRHHRSCRFRNNCLRPGAMERSWPGRVLRAAHRLARKIVSSVAIDPVCLAAMRDRIETHKEGSKSLVFSLEGCGRKELFTVTERPTQGSCTDQSRFEPLRHLV